jgi:murein DD-endopeptidase MepM/ murein hydrolase activator NlpD
MQRLKVPSRPRVWSQVAALALVGVAVAGCENSARFDSNPFASNRQAPSREVTGSVASRPAQSRAVVSQPLPAPSRPATVAATNGVAYGDRGYAAYRPPQKNSDVTGSVPQQRSAPQYNQVPPQPRGHWTWDGGKPVTVGYGETLDTVARRHGVPLSALMQTNGITNQATIRPGQRLVIPRYVYDTAPGAVASAAPAAPVAPAAPTPRRAGGNVHVVAQGEGLMSIARHYGVSLAELARTNKLQPYSRLKLGDRLTIPGGQVVGTRQVPSPKVAHPRTVAVEKKVASVPPTQTARIAKPEVQQTESITQKTEPAGGIPSFRWPVKGRIIAGFGPRSNGTQNDGINLAVPAGTPVKAAEDGVVAYAGNELKGYGNLVLIRHSGGYVSAYANASDLLVKRGDTVKRGQVIAHAGQTGNVTSPQLHFEIRKRSTPIDPTKLLSGA